MWSSAGNAIWRKGTVARCFPNVSTPRFSIIIQTYNRPRQLGQCLESVTRLDYPREGFEILVVDDGGTADLGPVIEASGARLLRQANQGPAAARNTGAGEARGDFLAFTDDDCRPGRNWLRALERPLEANPEALAGGATINGLIENPYATASQMLCDHIMGYYHSRRHPLRFFTTNNLAVAAGPFRQRGGFSVSFRMAASEDRELCDRWLGLGGEMIYALEAKVWHYHEMGLGEFLRQHYDYGRGALHFRRVRRHRTKEPIRLERPDFYLRMVVSPFQSRPAGKAAVLASLLVLSQAASAAGFLHEGITR